ncbi:stage V sporulation protein AD [Jeotgalibacillus proteolyticus]|uniref:Stage V sporulation protein AD n=1 Tax=Jeotgalibacillus proteolyticus TaxID=2082395 RepID=A0A2S5GH47_9BACL|nr:stage V sporulation protein AD [Jeotgalibacillus proteolyticus]PPA72309.1 stage V sporulation protein AD [Jeotgalibacillus proteolyticus]
MEGKSWIFKNRPAIVASGVVGGPFEQKSPYSGEFDLVKDTLWMEEESFEKANRQLIESAIQVTLDKKTLSSNDIDALLMGDLINQITPTSMAARTLSAPYLGLFSACATSMEGLALSAALIDGGYCQKVLTGASSHNAAVEKQFRYPTEYGGQKPPTAQWTVTGAGVALIEKASPHNAPLALIEKATIGKVVDNGIKDPFNMGAAMAPAAADVIERHLNQTNQTIDDFDLIITGDLSRIGHPITEDLLKQKGIAFKSGQFLDCGKMFYPELPDVQAGASGPACSAMLVYSHFLNELQKGSVRKILSVATGALLSPLTFQQGESIPCIAHAVELSSPAVNSQSFRGEE